MASGAREGVASEFGVYVHIPFCARRCDYCAFATWTDKFDLAESYVDACVTDIGRARARGQLRPATTVYLGGGTPSLLPPELLTRLLEAIERTPGAEVTIEANPESTTRAFLLGRRARWRDPDLLGGAVARAPRPRGPRTAASRRRGRAGRHAGRRGRIPDLQRRRRLRIGRRVRRRPCRDTGRAHRPRTVAAARQRLRAHRRGRDAARPGPGPPPRRRRRGRALRTRRRDARRRRAQLVRDLELVQARPRVSPQPRLLARRSTSASVAPRTATSGHGASATSGRRSATSRRVAAGVSPVASAEHLGPAARELESLQLALRHARRGRANPPCPRTRRSRTSSCAAPSAPSSPARAACSPTRSRSVCGPGRRQTPAPIAGPAGRIASHALRADDMRGYELHDQVV